LVLLSSFHFQKQTNNKSVLKNPQEPNGTYLSRYLNPLNEGLNLQDIRIYGRQILEAIKFLISLEIPVLHLHTGNIILSQGVCRSVSQNVNLQRIGICTFILKKNID